MGGHRHGARAISDDLVRIETVPDVTDRRDRSGPRAVAVTGEVRRPVNDARRPATPGPKSVYISDSRISTSSPRVPIFLSRSTRADSAPRSFRIVRSLPPRSSHRTERISFRAFSRRRASLFFLRTIEFIVLDESIVAHLRIILRDHLVPTTLSLQISLSSRINLSSRRIVVTAVDPRSPNLAPFS